MIDIKTVVPVVQKRLQKCSAGKGVELKTYKRDRRIFLLKLDENRYLVQEDGFEKQEFEVATDKLKKTLKSLLKKEFPRSRKVWLSERMGADFS